MSSLAVLLSTSAFTSLGVLSTYAIHKVSNRPGFSRPFLHLAVGILFGSVGYILPGNLERLKSDSDKNKSNKGLLPFRYVNRD